MPKFNVVEECTHSYSSATCELPSTCTLCGDTNGTALGHSWSDATCELPATCTVCHKTEGTALGHSWVDANYDAPKTCSVCHKTEGEPLEAKGCAKCNKSSVTLILLFTSALTTIGLFLRKRGIK